jgi:hypothetical protein
MTPVPQARPPIPPRGQPKSHPPPPVLASLRRRLKLSALRAIDQGWFGFVPLRAHLVITGFPRSGTTLLQLMVQASVPEARCFPHERSGFGAAINVWPGRFPFLVTKRPDDIYWIDDIRSLYAERRTRTKPVFVLCVRDPRAVLTSRHESNKQDYWVSIERWRAIYDHFLYARRYPDVDVIDFRQIVTGVDQVEQQISRLVGWTPASSFENFWTHVPDGFDTTALNGVRRLDASVLDKWARPEHTERIRYLLREMPELPDRLMEMGYERDREWTRAYE